MRAGKLCKLLSFGLAAALLFSGCGSKAEPAPETSATAAAETGSAAAPESSSESTAAAEESSEAETTAVSVPEETTAGSAENAKPESEFIKAPVILRSEFPSLDGSTATLPLGRMLYRLCTGADEETAEQGIEFTKTTNAYIRLMDGESDLVIAYEPGPKAKEDPRFSDIEMAPIGLDALVFLKNAGNPVESLSTEQIRDIYTGKIVNWKDVGGSDQPVMAFQRNLNSGSQTLMEDLIMKGTPMMDAPAELRPSEMGDLIDSVANYNNEQNAIGYSVYYYARNLHSDPLLDFMAVDGVAPDNESIRSGSYQYTNPFYAAVRKDVPKDSHAYRLYQWLTDTDGQSLVEAMGYVSVTEGGKKLPKAVEGREQADDFRAESGAFRLAVDAEFYDGSAGVIVFDPDFKSTTRFSSIRIPNNENFCFVRGSVFAANEPKYTENIDQHAEDRPYEPNYDTLPTGLFDADKGDWAVEPGKYGLILPVYETENDEILFYAVNWPEYSDEQGNELPVEGSFDVYDGEGNYVRDIPFHNDEEFYEIMGATYRKHEVMEYDEATETNSLAVGDKLTLYIRYGDNNRAWIEKNGMEIAHAQRASIDPIMGYGSDDMFPKGWLGMDLYNMDEDYNVIDDRYFLIDPRGEIRLTRELAGRETVMMCTDSYLMIRNYQTGKAWLEDYEGRIITEWTTPYDYSDGED